MAVRRKKHFFTNAEKLLIARLYPTTTAKEIAERLGLTERQIRDYLYRNSPDEGLQKAHEARSEICRENAYKRWRKQ